MIVGTASRLIFCVYGWPYSPETTRRKFDCRLVKGQTMKMIPVISETNEPIPHKNSEPTVGNKYTKPNVFQNAVPKDWFRRANQHPVK